MRRRDRLSVGLVAAMAASLLGACGDGSGGAGEDATGTSSTTSSGGSGGGGDGGDDGTGGSGATGGGGDAPAWEGEPLPTRVGSVAIRNLPDPDDTDRELGSATAYFFDDLGSSGCTRIVDGPCAAYRCEPSDPIQSQAAGIITVTGTTPPVTLEPHTAGQPEPGYPKVPSEGPFWVEGDVITVSAAGGVVPAFEATLVAPTRATVTAPDLGKEVVVSRAEGLDLAWTTEGEGGELMVSIFISGEPVHQLVCAFPLGDGAATIPPTILSHLPATVGAGIGFANRAEEVVDAGGFEVTVHLGSLAHAAGAPLGLASGEVTLE